MYLSIQRWSAEVVYAKVTSQDSTLENRDERIADLRKSVSLNSKAPRYWHSLSRTLNSKVLDIISDVSTREASPGQSAITQDESAQIQRLTTQIFGALQQARQLDPENSSLLIGIAETYKSTNSYVAGANDLAIDVYERSAELEPINPFIKTQLAQLYLIKDNFFINQQQKDSELIGMAKEQLQEAVNLSPNYSNARYFLGFVLDREGDKAGALEQFERVLFFNQDNQAMRLIVQNLRSGRPALGPPAPNEPQKAPEGDAQGIPEN